jgi:hypothetical protein
MIKIAPFFDYLQSFALSSFLPERSFVLLSRVPFRSATAEQSFLVALGSCWPCPRHQLRLNIGKNDGMRKQEKWYLLEGSKNLIKVEEKLMLTLFLIVYK